MIAIIYNDDVERMPDLSAYAESYGISVKLKQKGLQHHGELCDKWSIEGAEEDVKAFIQDYGLEDVSEYAERA